MKITVLFSVLTLVFFACKNNKTDYVASGSFEAIEIIVSAETAGRIINFDLTEGDIIKDRQEIGCIDTVQLHLSKILLEANKKTILGKKTDIAVQIASIQEQIRNLESEKTRFENLVKSSAGYQKQVDDIEAQILILQRQLTAQKSIMQITNQGIENESDAITIQIAQIEDKIEKSKIKSPIDGTVIAKYAEKGETVQSGKALFKIADTETIFLKVYFTTSQLSQLKLGQNVKISTDFGKNGFREYDGVITWISDKSEFTPKSIQTKDERANLVYAAKIAVKNDGYLKIGMYGQVNYIFSNDMQ